MDMGEILQHSASSSSNPNKTSFELKNNLQQCDDITELPDEILSSVISHLTIAEAARTSVLSRRWETLWHRFHGTLEFDSQKKLRIIPHYDTRMQKMYDYASSTSRVLQLLSSPFLGSFVVRLSNVNRICTHHLDKCVQFAMKKRMKSFELDTLYISPVTEICRDYNFQVDFYTWIKSPCGLDNISSLTSISLTGVNVSEDLIQHLLVNCPLLVSLHVNDSSELLNLKILCGTTPLKLKYLGISGFNLDSIELCTPNLLTLFTNGLKVKLRIQNALKLIELSIHVHVVNERPESVSSYLPHLERLTLDFSISNRSCNTQLRYQFVKLNKLQHLTWRVEVYDYSNTVQLNSMLEASPFLHKFTLVTILGLNSYKELGLNVTSRHPHQCLKVLEIYGFTGALAQVKLVKYFILNTTALEEIILNVRGSFWENDFQGRPAQLRRSKLCALELKKYSPPRVSLVIIE